MSAPSFGTLVDILREIPEAWGFFSELAHRLHAARAEDREAIMAQVRVEAGKSYQAFADAATELEARRVAAGLNPDGTTP